MWVFCMDVYMGDLGFTFNFNIFFLLGEKVFFFLSIGTLFTIDKKVLTLVYKTIPSSVRKGVKDEHLLVRM